MTAMISRFRSAVVAIALCALGLSGVVTSVTAPLAADGVFSRVAATADELALPHSYDTAAFSNDASPSATPGAGIANSFAGEDSDGDDVRDTTGVAIIPRDRSFKAAFDDRQDFTERSFLAPPTTGPPDA